MRFAHLSDLHIGKRVNGFSMLEDQRYILSKIIGIIQEQGADAVLIAGDLYDKPVPPAEAVALCDEFLTTLAALGKPVLMISGNHDSAERISFAGRLLESSGVHIAPVFDGTLHVAELTDAFGRVRIFLLPFIKPVSVRRYYEDSTLDTYTDAVRAVLAHTPLPADSRNILLAHQFVTGAVRSESEEISVGGLDNVDASVFDGFDYVALGHIHRPQQIGRETVRYCGSPLKYSFSEAGQQKSVSLIDLTQKGAPVRITTVPLVPMRELREIKGDFAQIMGPGRDPKPHADDYIHITLTDEEDIPDAAAKLRSVYPNLMRVDYDNKRTRKLQALPQAEPDVCKTPLALFEEFYAVQNNQPMNEQQRALMRELTEEIWEEAKR